MPEATDCDATPRIGSISIMRFPRVFIIRQPPAYVPKLIATAAETFTHTGIVSPECNPPTTSANVMTPMVF